MMCAAPKFGAFNPSSGTSAMLEGTIVKSVDHKFLVEYDTLKDDNEITPLTEIIAEEQISPPPPHTSLSPMVSSYSMKWTPSPTMGGWSACFPRLAAIHGLLQGIQGTK